MTPDWQGKRAADLETVVQWAMSQTGCLPWRNPSHADLALDHDFDVLCKGYHGLYRESGGIALKVKSGMPTDAFTIIEAIKALDGPTAAQLIACAKSAIRPACYIGIEPREIEKQVGWRHARKKGKARKGTRKAPVIIKTWEPCEPETICAAREAYSRWHEGMMHVMGAVSNQLNYWYITTFLAHPRPWEAPLNNILDGAKTPVTVADGKVACDALL